MFLLVYHLNCFFCLLAAIHRLTLSLLNASGFKPRTNFGGNRYTKCNEFYEEIAMSFIVVAVKLVYGLDGATER